MSWKNDFFNPKKEYGIYPLIHTNMGEFEKHIDRHSQCGFGGVVANVKYSPDYPNNNEDWLNFKKGFDAYRDRGFRIWLYDEKGYPSGTASGAVLDKSPEFEAIGLTCFEARANLRGEAYYRADIPRSKLFKAFLLPLDNPTETEAIDITDSYDGNGSLKFNIPQGLYRLVVFMQHTLFDGTHATHSHSEPRRYINILNEKATKAFTEVTHDRYYSLIDGDFGKQVDAIFTDEPSMIGWYIPNSQYPVISWSEDFPALFEKRYGYPIERALLSVFHENTPHRIKRRCDFWDFTADMVANSYFKVLKDWCHNHGTKSTGHMLAEETLQAHIFCYGSFYRSAKQFDWPGIDKLSCNPETLMKTGGIPIARLAASFADVYDLGNAQSEASGIAEGWSKTEVLPEWIKASVNWHQAQGINIITSYFRWEKFKTDYIAKLNGYTARLGTLLRVGKRHSQTAILYPENTMWASFTPNEKGYNIDQGEDMNRVQNCFTKVSWQLLNRQIDFDYIDENEVQNATISDNTLNVLTRKYNLLILPYAFVLSEKTVKQLTAFIKAGGKVIAVDRMPETERETGASTPAFLELLSLKDKGLYFTYLSTFNDIKHLIPNTIKVIGQDTANADDGITAPKILSHIRKDDDKTIIFICNMDNAVFKGKVFLPIANKVLLCNPNNGEITPAKTENINGESFIEITLDPYDGLFLVTE